MAIRWMTYERRLTSEHGLKLGEQYWLPVDDEDTVFCTNSNEFNKEFIVVTYFGLSKHIKSKKRFGRKKCDYKGFIQFRINNTEYYEEPHDGKTTSGKSLGISNLVYPMGSKRADNMAIYILSGQNYAVGITIDDRDSGPLFSLNKNVALYKGEYIDMCMGYYLFSETDAVIANMLLEMGFPVTEKNIDWLKRKMIMQEDTYDFLSNEKMSVEPPPNKKKTKKSKQ